MKGNCTKLERYNGTGWDIIARRINLTGPSRMRETVEEELTIDCDPAGGSSTKKKAPGTKEIGDISVEVIWNPSENEGELQVTTATAAGTVTDAGDALVTVTSAAVSGSPLALNIPVTEGAPAEWAAQVRAGLASNAAVAEAFEISGSGTAIVLTRRPAANGQAPADDATLNVALATGTATGITSAATSADTRAGLTGAVNQENHHLFAEDFDTGTATFWRIVHPDAAESGIVTHATVKELGEPSYQANQTVKRTMVLEPTGEYHAEANHITEVTLPPVPAAPAVNWGH